MQPDPLQQWTDRIVIDEAVLTGKPIIKGTRLAVEFIIDLLAHGWNEAEILENYPGIVVEDIRACLAYASAMLHAEKVYPLPTRLAEAPDGIKPRVNGESNLVSVDRTVAR